MDSQQKRTTWWQRHRPTRRRLVQLYAALLYNAYIKGFLKGKIYTGRTKVLCVPGLNCYSCPAAVGACPLGALQNALASSGNRTGFYVFGILILWGLMLGRTVCGWLCPFGLIQELLHKIPTPKVRKSRVTRALTWLKYGILAVFAAAVPLWYGLRQGVAVPGFCKYICPAGTLEGALALLSHPDNAGLFSMLGVTFTRKLVILIVILLACVFCFRAFCRFLCPLGAIYGLFNRLALVGAKVEPARCTHCGACVRNCKMDVRCVGDRECIHCGECADSCAQGAVAFKAGRTTLTARARRIAQGAALAILVFALLWFNVIDRIGEAVTGDYGYDAGDELTGFTIECLDGTEFRLADTRGKVTFINLWATYCGPCIEELPYFDALAAAHPDDVAVLAVHSSMTTEDVPAFLAARGWSHISFAVDPEGEPVWNTVGGGAAMPQTVVLDRNGVVIYNQAGSVTPELLERLYAEASIE